MNENKFVTDLLVGADLCIKNAEQLIQQSWILWHNGKFFGGFLLSQLSIEEQAKALLLIKKSVKGEPLSKKDWMKFTKGRFVHQTKLRYMQKFDDDCMAEKLSKIGIDFHDVLRKRWTAEGLKNIEEYWNKISEFWKNYRFAHLYVDYDFKKGEWKELIQADQVFSMRSIMNADRLLLMLKDELSAIKGSDEK